MMKVYPEIKSFLLAIVALTICLAGCDDKTVENDLKFEEKLVVRSVLEAGKPVEVLVGKTLPLNRSFNSDDALIDDAIVKIKNGGAVYRLYNTGKGIYVREGLKAASGEKYELTVEWSAHKAHAETIVPFSTTFQKPSVVKEIVRGDTLCHLEGLLMPRSGAVYGCTWLILSPQDTLRIEDDIIPIMVRSEDKDLKGHLTVKSRNIPPEYFRKYRKSLYMRVHSFDEQFYKYFLTQDSNNASTNIFSQSGINLRWNVEGAIGMFIGKSDFIVKIP